jgi:hypothetical protein
MQVQQLRTRLAHRLGLSAITGPELERLDESLQAALVRLHTEGAPGFAYSEFVGETYGSAAVTISSHTANTSTITLSAAPTGLNVGDILQVGSDYYAIYSYSGTTLNVGAPIKSALTGTGTIYQRTVRLPTSGAVAQVVDLTNGRVLDNRPDGLIENGLEVQSHATGYEQRRARNGVAYISLWPCPDSAVRLAIRQNYALDDLTSDTEIPGTPAFFDAVLIKAVSIWRGLQTGGVTAGEVAANKQSASDSARGAKSGTSSQAQRRPNRRGR